MLFESPECVGSVEWVWHELPLEFPAISLDAFVVMPNHIHGIIIIEAGDGALPGDEGDNLRHVRPDRLPENERRLMLLPKAMRYLKLNSAKRINNLRGVRYAPVWQRSYYEHIIRSEEELNRVRQYIHDNPDQWARDRENPANQPGR